jgi:putative membrane protein
MKQILSDQDRSRLDQLIVEAEKRTKTQIVLAVVKRSDSYAELPWKAFALGATLSGLKIVILDQLSYAWLMPWTSLVAVAGVLVGGAFFALLAILWPEFARLFLSIQRAETETRQYAESLFLSRELFATTGRKGVLLMVGLFERRVILLPDKGLGDRLTGDAMKDVIAAMTPLLKRKQVANALETGLEKLTRILEISSPLVNADKTDKELPNQIIEEKGV